MSLIEMFVRAAKHHAGKLAIIDKTTGHRVTYRAALLRSLILSRKFAAFEPGMIGVMMPTSAGGILSVVAAVMSGRTPVMINFSTGAEQNCRMAQRRLAFRTIITSRALLDRLKCRPVDGMVFIEDLAAGVSRVEALRGLLARLALGRRHLPLDSPGGGRRERRHPVHQRKRARPEGRAAHPP